MQSTLFLDVDGVLVNGRPSDGFGWASQLEKDLGIDPDLLNRHFFVPHWSSIVTGRVDLRPALQSCLPQISKKVTVEEVLAYWFENDARIDVDILPQVAQLRAKGVSVYLATNQEHLRAGYLMNDLGLSQHFDGMIYSAAVGAKKPEKAFYSACESISGRKASESVLVDDTLANVTAARNAGWRALHWTGTETLTNLFQAG